MQIYKKELVRGLKTFVIWALMVVVLVLGGMTKGNALMSAENGGLGDMLSQFPKAVLAMFGMAEANVETFGGFYSVLEFYIMIIVCCCAVSYGTNSVLRENIDKTYEFLFTKPCGRMHILTSKLLAGFTWVCALCAVNAGASALIPVVYDVENAASAKMPLFWLGIFLTSSVFFSLSALLSAAIKRSELAVKISYRCFLLAYALSVVFDMDERLECVRFLTPLKYFRASELLDGVVSPSYTAAALVLTAAFTAGAFVLFRRKDLTAA